MIRFPYGVADFYRIATEGFLYFDRTLHIRRIETLGDALLFIRPRRFGKSLWLRTLACYYDLRLADEFDRLFGKLAIGREPTELHNRYFVLSWDFSEVSALGDAAEIGRRLDRYVNDQIVDFLVRYEGHLPRPVPISETATNTFRHLLTALSETPYRLYLLIDEYDNFINEVMVRDADTYHGLVRADGPFKELLKSVKSAMQGQGLERLFITGVSPVALSDVSSGFNVARNIYRHPHLNALCGFTEGELAATLDRMVDEDSVTQAKAQEALGLMRDWYNGYRFSAGAGEAVYNPTSCLYFLQELQDLGLYPAHLLDHNLATDQGKLAFLSRLPAGARVVVDLLQNDGEITIDRLEDRFTLEDLAEKIGEDDRFVASFLYYLGLLTDAGTTPELDLRLVVPNLVVEKIYVDRLAELLIPKSGDRSRAQEWVREFLADGNVERFLRRLDEALLPILSNRDYLRMDEQALKMIFLTLFFDDRRYAVFSEIEAARGYADLCLLLRPEARARSSEVFDLLFELKYVALGPLKMTGEELGRLGDDELRALPPVRKALAEAREQIDRYRRALEERFGNELRLRCYGVVAVGFERLVGESLEAGSINPRPRRRG